MACGKHAEVLFVRLLLAFDMAIVITGGSGFVGQHLIRALHARGNRVQLWSRGDDVAHTFAGAEVVVHLAARVHVMAETSADPLREFREVNVITTERLARAAAAAGVRRFVFMSTVKVNGEESQPGCAFTERDLPQPQDPYGVSKYEAETVLQRVAQETGMSVVIIRAPLVYGPGVRANFAQLMQAVRRGWPLPLGRVKNLRSLVGVDNLVDFVMLCMHHPAAENETFLVSDGHDMSTVQLIQGMADAAGVSARVWLMPLWLLQTMAHCLGKGAAVQRLCGDLQVDIAKARTLLNWQPPFSVQEGLKRTMVQG
jgi:nucleoside-diphosphate-sugar epimerase